MNLLTVVQDAQPNTQLVRPSRLVAVAPPMSPRIIDVGYRLLALPLVSLLLLEYCQLGELVDTHSEYGKQLGVKLAVLYRGAKLLVSGAVVPLVGSADLLLPPGFFG